MYKHPRRTWSLVCDGDGDDNGDGEDDGDGRHDGDDRDSGDDKDADDIDDDDGNMYDGYHDDVGCDGTCIYGAIGASMGYA